MASEKLHDFQFCGLKYRTRSVCLYELKEVCPKSSTTIPKHRNSMLGIITDWLTSSPALVYNGLACLGGLYERLKLFSKGLKGEYESLRMAISALAGRTLLSH